MEITQEQFQSYVDVQMSGVTNMFDVRTVSAISGLDRDQITDIMKNYTKYQKDFETVSPMDLMCFPQCHIKLMPVISVSY